MRPSPTGRYRKQPVVVRAFRLTDDNISSPTLWPSWFRNHERRPECVEFDRSLGDGPEVVIHTLEGPHYGQVGDWIIEGVKGEVYPCKPEIFEATYRPESTQDEPAHDPFVDVVFDGLPSGPDGPRFIEVEDESGASVRCGNWVTRGRLAALRIRRSDIK